MTTLCAKQVTYCPISVRAHSSGGSNLLITSSVTSSGQELIKLCIAVKKKQIGKQHYNLEVPL